MAKPVSAQSEPRAGRHGRGQRISIVALSGRSRSVEPIDDLLALDRKLEDLDTRIKPAVDATGSTLTDIIGVGYATAAVILGEVGDVRRSPSKHHFATYTGTAPLEMSSGEVVRHRLSHAGNRRLNHALHIVALSHKRYDERGGEYYAEKVAAGKGSKGALRCLKRRLADQVFRHLVDDQHQRAQRSPGGQAGTSLRSSVAGSHPDAGTSEQPHTGLREQRTPELPAASRHRGEPLPAPTPARGTEGACRSSLTAPGEGRCRSRAPVERRQPA